MTLNLGGDSGENRTLKLIMLSLFTALAIGIFVLENQIVLPFTLPGIKLGLSNAITLFLLTKFKKSEVFAVLVVRIILGSLLSGQLVSLSYSFVGGVAAFAAMSISLAIVKAENLWFVGIMGGVFHNLGQSVVAVLLFKNSYLLVYFFILGLVGVFTGFLTSIAALALSKFFKIKNSNGD